MYNSATLRMRASSLGKIPSAFACNVCVDDGRQIGADLCLFWSLLCSLPSFTGRWGLFLRATPSPSQGHVCQHRPRCVVQVAAQRGPVPRVYQPIAHHSVMAHSFPAGSPANRVHADCTFANLGGSDTEGCTECSSAINIGAISATVVNSTFFDPTPAPGATYLRISDNARVLLSDCEFSPASRGANAESPLFANESATIYSTDLGMSFRSDTDSIALTWPLPQAEEDHPNTSSTRFLRRDDPWFLRIRSVRPSPGPV